MSKLAKLRSEYTFVFGKRKPFENGVVREFEKLHVGANLSRESLGLLNDLCKSFRWCGVGPDIWSPVPATVALNNPQRLLVCRILDDGSDNINRPHLVRVEAVEVLLEHAGGVESLRPFLDPNAWSIEGPEYHVLKKATTNPIPLDKNLDLTEKVGTWSIGGDPTSFVFKSAEKEYKPTSGWSIPKPKDLQQDQLQSSLKIDQIRTGQIIDYKYNKKNMETKMNILKTIYMLTSLIVIFVLCINLCFLSNSILNNDKKFGSVIKSFENNMGKIFDENKKRLKEFNVELENSEKKLKSINGELKKSDKNLYLFNEILNNIKKIIDFFDNKLFNKFKRD